VAYDYSDKIFEQNKFLKKPMKNLLCKNWRLVSKYRGIFRKIHNIIKLKSDTNLASNFEVKLNKNFEEYYDFFKKNHWCFIEDFFTKNTCDEIVNNWPKKFYFRPMKYISKQYDFGFEWNYKMEKYPKYLNRYQKINKLYDFINSSIFKKAINNNLCNDDLNRSCFSISLTNAEEGSILFPHKDAISLENKTTSDPAINIIIFLKGIDFQDFSGGTGLYNDNEFKKIIFEPNKLNNTALIYKSNKNFFHGFREIKGKNKIRYTLNTQFTCL
tara:strand:- start:415 stop:1227 length:813 start_codon:yes stop_codon:yes gene_type:complete